MPGHEWRSLSWLHEGAALTVQRPLFALWSDPITVAAGVEYRSESARQTTSANTAEIVDYTGVRGGPAGLAGRVGPFIVGNPQPLAGSFDRSEEHTSELQSLMRISYAVFCLKKKRESRKREYNIHY